MTPSICGGAARLAPAIALRLTVAAPTAGQKTTPTRATQKSLECVACHVDER